MKAWHDAQRERSKLSESERRGKPGENINKKIDGLRDGQFPDGTPRQFPPEDAPVAVEAKERATRPEITGSKEKEPRNNGARSEQDGGGF